MSSILPSSFGGSFDLQDFYRPFRLDEITPENMQLWPYYKRVSAHWPDYVQTSTAPIRAARSPVTVEQGESFDLNGEFRGGKTYLQSLLETQVKGFVVLRRSEILAEFYDNGFNLGDTNLLQSASKTFAGVVTHTLIDAGLLDVEAEVGSILAGFEGTTIGDATVQHVLDMTSGAATLLDFHTAGSLDQQWEVEIGLQGGTTMGHFDAIRAAPKVAEPGVAWNYSDMNTDTLALLAEHVSGKRYVELISELFDEFGANDGGSIALSSDGMASPCYGISLSTRDFALFHQWLAQRKAPRGFYSSAMDISKDLMPRTQPLAAEMLPGTTYGSQAYYMVDHNILHSSGSFGQIGMSDMETGIAVATHSDWANNAEPEKFEESRSRAIAIIEALR